MALDLRTQMQTPDFRLPPEVYQLLAQAIQQKNQMYQGLGQNLSQGFGTGFAQGRQIKAQNQFGQDFKNALAPVQGPTTEQGQKPIQPPINYGALSNSFGKAYPDQAGQFSEKIISQLMKQQTPNKPMASIWVNPEDPTSLSPNPVEGWTEYKTSQGDALNKITGVASSKARNKAMTDKAEVWNRAIDTKQINELTKRIGLTSKQQSALQTNNLRADRAIEILSNPSITWQELALGEVDLAGIMQGGVPHIDEVKNTHFPGWQQNWASWKTYATGHPTENVPDPIRKKVLGLVQDVVQIDNKFLNANKDFSKSMIAPTIRGGIGQFQDPINKMTNVLTTQPQSKKTNPITSGPKVGTVKNGYRFKGGNPADSKSWGPVQ